MEPHTETTDTPRTYPGRLAFYHPTGTGGGAAVRFELKRPRGDHEGCFFMECAKQKTRATREPEGARAATFDWESKITVKLGFSDLCALLLVLNGKAEQLGGGRGLFHDSRTASTVIGLRHQAEPAGYALEVSRKANQPGAEAARARLVLSEAEALGLGCILEQSLPLLVFGPAWSTFSEQSEVGRALRASR